MLKGGTYSSPVPPFSPSFPPSLGRMPAPWPPRAGISSRKKSTRRNFFGVPAKTAPVRERVPISSPTMKAMAMVFGKEGEWAWSCVPPSLLWTSLQSLLDLLLVLRRDFLDRLLQLLLFRFRRRPRPRPRRSTGSTGSASGAGSRFSLRGPSRRRDGVDDGTGLRPLQHLVVFLLLLALVVDGNLPEVLLDALLGGEATVLRLFRGRGAQSRLGARHVNSRLDELERELLVRARLLDPVDELLLVRRVDVEVEGKIIVLVNPVRYEKSNAVRWLRGADL